MAAWRALLVAAFIGLGVGAAAPRPQAVGKPGINPVACPQQDWQFGDPAFEALPGAKAYAGRYDGGLYRVEIPDTWNGELVLYAHGFVGNGGENGSNLRVGNHPIREHLIAGGFAWAASSYRCNGYVPGQGLVDTMALVTVFTQSNGGRAPQRIYLTGTSMGGHVTVLGLHQFPTAFAGGLAMCPAGPELFDFFAGVGAAAEQITGIDFKADELRADLDRMAAGLGKPPDYTDRGRELANVEIAISGGPRPFAAEGLASGGRFLGNISGGALAGVDTPQNRAVDTTRISYPADLNARVRRKRGDATYRGADTPYQEVAPFDGRLARPLLTMHGTGDLFVPIFLEQTLKRAVAAAGKDDLLVQRIYRIAGHCQFSQPEMIRAFDDLVAWVHRGTKPAGDNVDGDLRDAGRTFTDPLRPGDPGHLQVAAPQAAPPARVDFVRDVQPIFRQQCYGCHGPAIHQNGFRLDRRADAMRGGTISVIGRDSATSRLYMRVAGVPGYGPQMPPTGPLTPAQIDTIKRWIDEGADWPDAAAGDEPPRPTPPLMRAALEGDLAEMRRLLDEGADVNAANDSGATALMWAVDDLAKTRLLVDRGANVNAKSDDGRTPLLIAAGFRGNAPVVTLLLEHGANPSATAPGFGGSTHPLMEAAWIGEPEIMRLLIAAGADAKNLAFVTAGFALHSRCRPCFDLVAPSLDAEALSTAPFVVTAPDDDATGIRPLIERGSDVNRRDGEGRTVLMRTAASDVVGTDVIQLLLAKGADVQARTPSGRTAVDFARAHGNTPVVALLTKAGATAAAADVPTPTPSPATTARAAVERSIALLQQSDVTFMKKSGCVSCHNNTLTMMTVSIARAHGIRVDEETAQQQSEAIARYLESWRERALQNNAIPGVSNTVGYILLGMSAEGVPPSDATDAMARFILHEQAADGRWWNEAHRPPIESNDIQATATAVRALQVYAPRSQRAKYDAAIRRAAGWLAAATPRATEERAFQLLGLAWTHAARAAIQKAARALVALQRPDGGWSQLPTLASDAYATGEALVALEQSGAITAADPAYRRGTAFLLNMQLADGSWFVHTRAIPIQPYFESGFPHGHDQFISAAATNWAAMALAATVH